MKKPSTFEGFKTKEGKNPKTEKLEENKNEQKNLRVNYRKTEKMEENSPSQYFLNCPKSSHCHRYKLGNPTQPCRGKELK